EAVHTNAIRVHQAITGLLDFANLQGRKVPVERRATDLGALTQSVLADFEPLLRQKRLDCLLSVAPPGVWVSMDRYLYERVLFNLLSNAVKFTPEGGRLEVRLAVADDRLALAVQDTGVGIVPAEVRTLFGRFRPLEGTTRGAFHGPGLGLALIKEF